MHYLGQHFLKDQTALEKIAAALELKKDDLVIEVGPGHGELTQEILGYPIKKLIAVEKDKKLADNFRFQIIEGDILEVLPSITKNLKNYKLVGNIPYYLTGFLLRTISELENKPQLIVFTIQKEVAERIVAQPPRTNLLSASVQFWAEPEILFTIPAGSFNPPPKVESSVIRLRPRRIKLLAEPVEAIHYYKFIKTLFKQPRKTILNNLLISDLNKKEFFLNKIKTLGLNEKSRAQELSVEQIIALAKQLS